MGTVLDEATRENRGKKSHKEEKQHRQELADHDTKVLRLIIALTLLAVPSLCLAMISAWRRLPSEHELKEVFWRHEVTIIEASKMAALETMVLATSTTASVLSPFKSVCIPKLIVLAFLCRV